eukprot:jgi/Mesvir1/11115/Mv06254-RA.1
MASHLAECLNGKTRDGLVEVEELFRGVLAVAAPETFLLALGRMEGRPERAKVVFVHASDGRAIGGADLLQMACIAAPQGAQVVDVHGDHFAADTILVPTAYMHVVRLIKDRLKLGSAGSLPDGDVAAGELVGGEGGKGKVKGTWGTPAPRRPFRALPRGNDKDETPPGALSQYRVWAPLKRVYRARRAVPAKARKGHAARQCAFMASAEDPGYVF